MRCLIVKNAGHVDPIMSVMKRRGEFWMRLCCFVKGDATRSRRRYGGSGKVFVGFGVYCVVLFDDEEEKVVECEMSPKGCC